MNKEDDQKMQKAKYLCPECSKSGDIFALNEYNSKINAGITRYLYLCDKCGSLYFKGKEDITPAFIGKESILIANIDSPSANTTTDCPECGKVAHRATSINDERNIYFCHNCYATTQIIEKPSI